MTISVSDNTPRVSYSVSEGATQTSFTVSFEFFADADLNVYVDGTKKSLTTHYSVTGGDGSTGSISMSVTGASGGSTVVITRGIALERTTDFPVSGAFAVGTLNTELDRFVAIQADLNDTITRSVRLQDDDSAVSMELPLKAARLGTVLGFNASTGAVEAGPTIANVNSLSAITANINTVGGISANVTTVAGIHDNVTTVAGISSNVTTVAGISSNVTTVAGKASLITSDFAADMALIDSTFVTKMNLVTSDFVTDMAAVTSDFISDLNTLATSDIVSDLNTLATSDIVSDINTLATSAIVEDLNLLATSSVIADMATLAGSGASPNITSVTASGAITAGSFVIGSADINENDLEAIDGVTAGTVAASKAVVVDTNKDISSFRNLTATGEVGVGRLNLSSTVSSSDLGSDAAQVGYSSADGLLLMGQGSSSDIVLINDTGTIVGRIPTGTTTFQMVGSGQVTAATGGILYLSTSEATVVANDSLGLIHWSATGEEAPDGTAMSGAIECTAEGTFSGSANPTQMLFKLGVSEAATTKMTLSSNGDLNVTGGITTGGSLNAVTDIIGTSSDMTIKNTANGENIFLKTTSSNSLITPVKIHSGGVFEAKLGAVFNEDSADVDFRVESNGNENMLFVDGGNDAVGIGTGSPDAPLEIEGTNSSTTQFSGYGGLRIHNTNGSAHGVTAEMYFTAGTGGSNRGTAIGAEYTSASSGNDLYFATNGGNVTSANTLTERMRITSGGSITTPDAGTKNTKFGSDAGVAIVSGGTYNSTFGCESGLRITSGDRNSCFGYKAGANISTGNDNVCLGYDTGCDINQNLGITTTSDHICIGRGAGMQSNATSANIFIGTYAGIFASGGNNCVLGFTSGYAGGQSNYLLAGHSNTLLGNYTNLAAGGDNTSVVVGQGGTGKGTGTGFIQATNGVYQSNNSSSWSTTSDRRLKKNIVDSQVGLEEINKIQVREFEYRTEEEITELDGKIDKIDKQGVQVGVIAQEIQKILPNCVKETSQGVLIVDSDNLTWHLIKAVQELTARLEALEGA